jgi:hypothetical protein
MVGGLVPNMFASSNRPVGLSTSEKAFQPRYRSNYAFFFLSWSN